MASKVLKFKYTSDKAVTAIVADIKFCGATIKEKTKVVSQKLIYIAIEENDESFSRRFKNTRSGNFLLN